MGRPFSKATQQAHNQNELASELQVSWRRSYNSVSILDTWNKQQQDAKVKIHSKERVIIDGNHLIQKRGKGHFLNMQHNISQNL